MLKSIVIAPPLMGKTTFVNRELNKGTLAIVDLDIRFISKMLRGIPENALARMLVNYYSDQVTDRDVVLLMNDPGLLGILLDEGLLDNRTRIVMVGPDFDKSEYLKRAKRRFRGPRSKDMHIAYTWWESIQTYWPRFADERGIDKLKAFSIADYFASNWSRW